MPGPSRELARHDKQALKADYVKPSKRVFDNAKGTFIPLPAPFNSERLPLFHQLDLRVDKAWVFKRTTLSLYLDVQNVYNRRNPEIMIFAYDFSNSQPINSLPAK